MGQDRLIDLLPGLTAEDVRPDTDENVIDVNTNIIAAEARTYSL